ncbi:MAG TPA: VIT family protein [Usitatibacter sp.]|nr:VIT family protein [Usitatibacter sp.]
MRRRHGEHHTTARTGWLRAAVLGANDGIVSTSSLIVGVAAASTSHAAVILAGTSALVAGAMSMAAGEYVSVHSQADSEKADLEREREELATDRDAERRELAGIYRKRGLEPALADQVAKQLMAKDALAAHARDELGITKSLRARPLQAALASAASFSLGAAMPLVATALSPMEGLIPIVGCASLVFLALLGVLAAWMGGAPIVTGALRVTFWGAIAMGVTAGVGTLFGGAAG